MHPTLENQGYFEQLITQGIKRLQGDLVLFYGLAALIGTGLIVLYSSSNANLVLMSRQAIRVTIALSVMLVLAQIPPMSYRAWTPWLFVLCLLLLSNVLLIGIISKGAQRWLSLWLFRFQPSELMKLSIPMMLAWYLHDKPLPPSPPQLIVVICLILFPALLVAKQPDLGTALLITLAGFGVILLTGIRNRHLLVGLLLALVALPVVWYCLHDYQRSRILTFLNPKKDPLGAGYHILQSKITIGSGGFFGKGWLHGTQCHLQFLPEHSTDFIFAVFSEEFGFIGATVLVIIYLGIIYRSLYISLQARDTFSRLLAGSLSVMFFFATFVNIAMVCGILPIVGVPLPLMSYGGTSLITLLAGFGILMSISRQRA